MRDNSKESHCLGLNVHRRINAQVYFSESRLRLILQDPNAWNYIPNYHYLNIISYLPSIPIL